MYGTQTFRSMITSIKSFENDVKMYGTQTSFFREIHVREFENDVKMYGTQTDISLSVRPDCLRMM